MAGEIIRKGDKTNHDGVVLEGSMTDICMGMPIAYIGHKVHCPRCKGDFPIVEGAPATIFYGKGVALAGMKTSCGAILIPTQFTDIVGDAGGSSAAGARPVTSMPGEVAVVAVASAAAAASTAQTPARSSADETFDEQYELVDDDGVALANLPFTVKFASGKYEHGITDGDGRTGRYVTEGEQSIEVYLGHVSI